VLLLLLMLLVVVIADAAAAAAAAAAEPVEATAEGGCWTEKNADAAPGAAEGLEASTTEAAAAVVLLRCEVVEILAAVLLPTTTTSSSPSFDAAFAVGTGADSAAGAAARLFVVDPTSSRCCKRGLLLAVPAVVVSVLDEFLNPLVDVDNESTSASTAAAAAFAPFSFESSTDSPSRRCGCCRSRCRFSSSPPPSQPGRTPLVTKSTICCLDTRREWHMAHRWLDDTRWRYVHALHVHPTLLDDILFFFVVASPSSRTTVPLSLSISPFSPSVLSRASLRSGRSAGRFSVRSLASYDDGATNPAAEARLVGGVRPPPW